VRVCVGQSKRGGFVQLRFLQWNSIGGHCWPGLLAVGVRTFAITLSGKWVLVIVTNSVELTFVE
jgi:hypothetical protein